MIGIQSHAWRASSPARGASNPESTASTISPRTSSITAAPRMIRPSLLSARPRSASTRAVIPTLVAQSVAPTNQSASEPCVAKKARVTKNPMLPSLVSTTNTRGVPGGTARAATTVMI